jgi:hypothetical protein
VADRGPALAVVVSASISLTPPQSGLPGWFDEGEEATEEVTGSWCTRFRHRFGEEPKSESTQYTVVEICVVGR